ncbi:MAG: fructose bisphosphate aldolase [Bacilli bacterium]|jgi:fructose-bisphosphate aldolase class I|nr:fructose bisphosphate aldolase [Bacilli bacterium]
MNATQLEQMHSGKGFIAALDQSGGSTPKALKLYGIDESAWKNEEEMFDLVHEMRTRIINSPAFASGKILGAILFRQTMERKIGGMPTADYLWEKKHVVPFLKVDLGLDVEKDGVRLMKPFPGLDELCKEANTYHIFGTKERSVILAANKEGIRKVVDQQFEWAKIMIKNHLVPIIEPEVDIHISDKKEAEAILKEELKEHALKLGKDEKIMFKLSLPSVDGFYGELEHLPCVVRVVALSGGYSQKDADEILARNPGVIASFSRALSEGLTAQMNEKEFDAKIAKSINDIYEASVK